MADFKDVFRTEESQNWCKCMIAASITSHGLVDLVKEEIDILHRECLQDITQEDMCSVCVLPNLLQCPTEDICHINADRCSFHSVPYNSLYFSNESILSYLDSQMARRINWCLPRHCYFHGKLLSAIKEKHRYSTPSLKHTDVGQWAVESWELAKCYMEHDSNTLTLPFDNHDIVNICSVVINCSRFQRHFEEDLSNVTNRFAKIKRLMNMVVNTRTFKICTSDLNECLEHFIASLEDSKYLRNYKKSIVARDKLLLMKSDNLTITTGDALHVVQDIQSGLTTYFNNMVASERHHTFNTERVFYSLLESSKQTLNNFQDVFKNCLGKQTLSLENVISKTKQEQLTRIQNAEIDVRKARETHVKNIQSEMKEFTDGEILKVQTEIRSLTDAGIEQIRTEDERKNVLERELNYNALKKELKNELTSFYPDRLSSLPLSPLVPEIDARWSRFYVSPKLKMMNSVSSGTNSSTPEDKENGVLIDSYQGVFMKGTKLARHIYIQGEPGIGKSSFCTSVTMTWCERYLRNAEKDVSETEVECTKLKSSGHTLFKATTEGPSRQTVEPFSDQNVLDQFDFVFAITLRNAKGTDCDVDKMIKHQILKELPGAVRYTDTFIEEILRKERSLIILDGLDEWSHPDDECIRLPKYIPHRRVRMQCTILTTTRPWKLTQIRVKNSEIDHLIELLGITNPHALVEKCTVCLNESFQKSKSSNEFLKIMKSKSLNHYLSIPIMLMQLLCLWHEGRELNKSKCEIYCNIIDMLFERANEKLECISENVANDQSDTELVATFTNKMPYCFRETECLQLYMGQLKALSKLSFFSLLSADKERSLVFDEPTIDKYLSKKDQAISLETGVLSQHKCTKSLTRRRSTYCFLHKTFQEFLAALYISQNAADADDCIHSAFEVYGKTEDLLDISEIFTFLCGLNPDISQKVSDFIMSVLTREIIDLSFGSIYRITRFQRMIISGYREARENSHKIVFLALRHAFITRPVFVENSSLSPLKDILSMDINKCNMVTLLISNLSANAFILDLLRYSATTVRNIGFTGNKLHHATGYELSKFRNLEFLFISKDKSTGSIRFPSSNLEVCNIGNLNPSLERDILETLATDASNLRTFIVEACENIDMLKQVLHTANLTYLKLTNIGLHGNLGLMHSLQLSHLLLRGVLNVQREEFSAESLVECVVRNCDITVEQDVLDSLMIGASGLRKLSISPCKMTGQLCKVLRKLQSLEVLYVKDAQFESVAIHLPVSVNTIEFEQVSLSDEVGMDVVHQILRIPHSVEFKFSTCDKPAYGRFITVIKETEPYVETDTNHFISVDDKGFQKQIISALKL